MSVNKVIILGRLGQDPELKFLPNGTAVCNFSLATSETWTDKSGTKQEKTEWHKTIVWGKLAELCNEYLKKGSQAYIEGKLQTRSWDDKDGTKRYSTEIIANTVQFISRNNNSGPNQTTTDNQDIGYSDHSSNFGADDIPF